ncbi:YDG/SRA domain-containing protein [Aquimarina algiphila]|uniref:YDG/SRA domain-containing protein n=1 Tax=Aquimarina algiphila TaxID=2047982 RepID=UPI002330F9A3|nr:YDG/SRA domain-containing protein [Aquimarina algiphila]
MPRPIIFGEIEGIEEGQWFQGRKEMMPTSFHRSWGSGIDGNGGEGTAAIVLSGGYEDDEDHGDEIVYTGAGGNDQNTRKQIADQSWKNPGNAGLRKNMNEGLPVRVIRGHTHKSEFSPERGYSYAGLYSVVDAWEETGKSGFKICRFRLIYSGDNTQRKTVEQIELDHSIKEKKRKSGTILRVVRDTKISTDIKKLYKYKCQVCGTAIKTKNGFYAEGAHIKPLGKPHDGDDSVVNLICLCPNHHVMFDKGTFSILDDFTLIGELIGVLQVDEKHKIDKNNLQYHRKSHGYD